MFIAALCATVRLCKQPKCPSADEETRCDIYIYIYEILMKYYAVIKKNEIFIFAAIWMDLEVIIHN